MAQNRYSVADSVASEMNSIMGSTEHQSIFAGPKPQLKKQAMAEEGMDMPSKECTVDVDGATVTISGPGCEKVKECWEDNEGSEGIGMEMGGMSADDMAQAFDQSVKALNSVSYVLDRFGFSKTAEDVLIALNNLVVEASEKEEDDEDEDEKKDEKGEKDEKDEKKDKKDDEDDAKGKADREEGEEKEGKTHSHSLPAKEHTHEGDKKSTEKDESVTEVDTKHTHPEFSFKKKDKGDIREGVSPESDFSRYQSVLEAVKSMLQNAPEEKRSNLIGRIMHAVQQEGEDPEIQGSVESLLGQMSGSGDPSQVSSPGEFEGGESLEEMLSSYQGEGPQTAGGGPASGQPLPGFEGEGDNASDGTYSAFASMLSAEHDRHMGFVRVAKAKGKDKGKEDPKAKVRNRGAVCVPAEKAKDNKDHFPINSEAQARNALARVNQFDKAPPWWSGSLQSLVNTVAKAVKSKYKGIEVSKKSTKPKKGSMESLLVALGSDRY